MMKRFILSLFAVLFCVPVSALAQFTLEPLPYAADALEPYVDVETMQVHHGRHHAAYVNNLNVQIANYPELASLPLDSLQGQMSKFNAAVRNNGGGHFNHSLFWTFMAPSGKGGAPSASLQTALTSDLGSLEAMKEAFNKAAVSLFGSGWVWLIVTPDKKLKITTTVNQDNPLMDIAGIERGVPILALDVWEHAYYIKYRNKRADYVANWWNVVNWNEVNARFERAMK